MSENNDIDFPDFPDESVSKAAIVRKMAQVLYDDYAEHGDDGFLRVNTVTNFEGLAEDVLDAVMDDLRNYLAPRAG